MTDCAVLESATGYRFSRSALLDAALTHRSFGAPHNERLEFLGDGVLNLAVADLLFERFPDLSEGDLSRLRANLVRQESLFRVACALDLGNQLRLGDGEEKSGGRRRASILADALEALIGAVYLDGGFERARQLVGRLFGEAVSVIDPARASKDAKTRLQEYLQGRRLPLPVYAMQSAHGEAHAQVFEVRCEIAALHVSTTGCGSTRRVAEQQAAGAALDLLDAK